jgi:hypothetical protein
VKLIKRAVASKARTELTEGGFQPRTACHYER